MLRRAIMAARPNTPMPIGGQYAGSGVKSTVTLETPAVLVLVLVIPIHNAAAELPQLA
jgi:hypothetical protein